ncbi:hypothetical protein EPH_0065230 [Eimeria praecox]|uniref:RanBD1 domain-containing protein n=1 Tax=Eimeria praecox TaxID=51316 RepID=U6H201_9EIME|nr:hypothetical protein EPH_0065230 [Eimeria praecox]
MDFAEGELKNEQFALKFGQIEQAKEFKEKFEEAAAINAKLFGISDSSSKEEGEKAEQKGEGEKTEKKSEESNKESQSTEAAKTEETTETSKEKESKTSEKA